MDSEIVDVVIVGAGLSGIGAASHLSAKCPAQTFTILESRAAMGGTWDLFRYPGVRSDSDMHTLGYEFKPWLADKAIADGESILQYIRDTAREFDIEHYIRYGHRVLSANWSSSACQWSVHFRNEENGTKGEIRCRILLMCSGYYDYAEGHNPGFENQLEFAGQILHPQFWPEDLLIKGKHIVVIGSGATAVTLVPALAKDAQHVTMLQRSPSYYLSMPDTDAVSNFVKKFLPSKWAYSFTRWKNTRFQEFIYGQTRTAPQRIRKLLLWLLKRELDDETDIERHFSPGYAPWDQRLCLVPNGDLFEALNKGSASMVTANIDRFTRSGIRLESGEEIAADIVVTATGLKLSVLGQVELTVDGECVNVADRFAYKSMMLSDVPNMILTFGYINASWTLRADIVADFSCRLINYMAENGYRRCTPRLGGDYASMSPRPWIEDFSSGYFQRAMHLLPRQGDRSPWANTQSYRLDKLQIRNQPVADDALEVCSIKTPWLFAQARASIQKITERAVPSANHGAIPADARHFLEFGQHLFSSRRIAGCLGRLGKPRN